MYFFPQYLMRFFFPPHWSIITLQRCVSSVVQQSESTIYICISPPSWTSLPLLPPAHSSHPSTRLECWAELPALYSWFPLAIIHTAVYLCETQSPNAPHISLCHPVPCPRHHVHASILSICFSIPGARFICTICFIFLTYFTLYVVCIYNVILLSYKRDLALNGKEVNHKTGPEGCRNQDSALEGLMNELTNCKYQCRGSSFKSAWVICERNSVTNFRVCIGRAGIWWNFLWVRKYLFFFFFFLLPQSWPIVGRYHFCCSPST